MTSQAVQIISSLTEQNEPYYGDCTLQVGGHPVEFVRGRAVAPRAVALLLTDQAGGPGNKDVQIPELGWEPSRKRLDGPRAAMTQDAFDNPPEIPEEIRALVEMDADTRQSLLDLAEGIKRGDLIVVSKDALATPPAGDPPEPSVDEAIAEADKDAAAVAAEQIQLAKEHLAADGEIPPEVEVERVLPAGFENKTGSGELRCLATTGAGAQCQNTVKDVPGEGKANNACSLDAHRKQLVDA